MDWTQALDSYCERLGPAFWAEPVNALSNLAFILVALILWPRVRGTGQALCVLLFAIGCGSFLFHTFAQPWAGVLDVVPILLFVLVYIFAANRTFWGLSFWPALGVTALFVPYAAAAVPVFGMLGLGSSSAYAPVPLLIALYAFALRRRTPQVSRGLFAGAGLLVLSLAARMADIPVCATLPLGTHFLWHLLNAIMLGWMIVVWQRHMLAGARPAR